MNRDWVLFHLSEALEELEGTIVEIRESAEYDDAEFLVAMSHLYHHLNTAVNSRDASESEIREPSDAAFKQWIAFPRDVFEFE